MGTGQSQETPAAALRAAAKRYGANVALDGLSLDIPRGRVTALLGPNGAGKSTAMSLLLGLAAPDSGKAELFGESPQHLSARRRIGVMLQSAALPDTLRVGELLRLTAAYYTDETPDDSAAEAAGVGDLMNRYYGKLSGGQQRRVQFALAICGDPDLICLDEPTVGMDTDSRAALWQEVRARVAKGCAVLLTTHYLEEAEAMADRVAVISKGRLVMEGTVDEVRSLSGSRRLRCRSTLSPEEVGRWDGVDRARRQEAWLEIETHASEAILRRLLNDDPWVAEIEVRRAGLAEALSQITQEHAS